MNEKVKKKKKSSKRILKNNNNKCEVLGDEPKSQKLRHTGGGFYALTEHHANHWIHLKIN